MPFRNPKGIQLILCEESNPNQISIIASSSVGGAKSGVMVGYNAASSKQNLLETELVRGPR